MPIYEYRCTACEKKHEALQKVSDLLLTECPHCHQATLEKCISRSAFQLSGAGWYETDFKNNSAKEKSVTENTATAAPSTETPAHTHSGDDCCK
jgi:putative FmdB family regulatory protein